MHSTMLTFPSLFQKIFINWLLCQWKGNWFAVDLYERSIQLSSILYSFLVLLSLECNDKWQSISFQTLSLSMSWETHLYPVNCSVFFPILIPNTNRHHFVLMYCLIIIIDVFGHRTTKTVLENLWSKWNDKNYLIIFN